MSRKPNAFQGVKTVKTSISMSDVVMRWAEEMCAKKGFDNFSAYLADLVRRDKERDERKEEKGPTPIQYPASRSRGMFDDGTSASALNQDEDATPAPGQKSDTLPDSETPKVKPRSIVADIIRRKYSKGEKP